MTSIAVLDHDQVLQGVVTVDDVLDAVEDEATEDMFRMAGSSATTSNPHRSLMKRVTNRMPWLMITALGGVMALGIMENIDPQTKVVIYFVPLVLGMSGNVGIQSSTVMVRGLAMDEIAPGRAWPVIWKELLTGIIIGLFFAVLAFVLTWLFIDPAPGDPTSMKVGLVVAAGLFSGVAIATCTGCLIPVLCERLSIDPALAAGPFVTTLNDCLGLTVYLAVATLALA